MRALRFLFVLLLLIALAVAALYVFRAPLAGMAVRAAMASVGLENPQARVAAIGPDGITLAAVAAGPVGAETFSFETIEADYDWRRLLSERAVQTVRLGPGYVRLALRNDGSISVPGIAGQGGPGEEGRPLPFSSVTLNDVALLLDTPDGGATGRLNGAFDLANGGLFSADVQSDALGLNGYGLKDLAAEAAVTLKPSGEIEISADIAGDVQHQIASLEGATISIEGTGGSWRDMANAVEGRARIAVSAPSILISRASNNVVTSAAPLEAIFGEPINIASLSGAFDAEFSPEGLTVRLAENEEPFGLKLGESAALTITPAGAPLYRRRTSGGNEGDAASFAFDLQSAGLNAGGSADIEREGAIARIAAPITLSAFTTGALSLDETELQITATMDGADVLASLAVRSAVRSLGVGRLVVTDAPFAGRFAIDANIDEKRATVVNEDQCLSLMRGKARLAEQNIDMALAGAELCNAGSGLAQLDWSGPMIASLAGELSANQGSFSLGQTGASGRPPTIDFEGVYKPAENTTTLVGTLRNGDVVLNNALDLSSANGVFDFRLDPETLRAKLDLARLEIAQHISEPGAAALVAPVIASGQAMLIDSDATFEYTLSTPGGDLLGGGEGTHEMSNASGQTRLTLQQIVFTPEGVQPEKLAPVLRGIVGETTGEARGVVRSSWAPGQLTSSADISLRDIVFAGPTRVVTKTRGLNGDIQLTNLWPITTAGMQTVTIAAVDLDALQLTDGVIDFSVPGDETVLLEKAEFPWFSGTLGAYEASASMKDGVVRIPLRAENANLKEMLEFANIESLSGEGILSGVLPLVIEDGKARIENGVLRSVSPGVIRYQGAVGDQAAATGEGAKVAFDLLRDLQFTALEVKVDGALEGRLNFDMLFEGAGAVNIRQQDVTVPVKYRINLDAALIELLNQARLSTDIRRQLQQVDVGVE